MFSSNCILQTKDQRWGYSIKGVNIRRTIYQKPGEKQGRYQKPILDKMQLGHISEKETSFSVKSSVRPSFPTQLLALPLVYVITPTPKIGVQCDFILK